MTPEEEKLLAMGSVFLIEVGKIIPNPMQPRTEFDQEKLRDLADSIKQYGVLQPLVVTRRETETESGVRVEYELIAGERRLRASRLAGLNQVPVVIRREEYSDRTKLELAIIENLQREDLNALERAKAFKKLVDEFRLKHHEVAARVGKSREYVSNTLRLLGLPEEMQMSLSKGDMTEGHSRAILALDERPEDQMSLYREIVGRKISVRQAEKIVRSIIRSTLKPEELLNLEVKSMERRLADSLGTNVHIEMDGGRGKIHIDFFSSEELEAFLKRLTEQRIAEIAAAASAVAEGQQTGQIEEMVQDDTILPPPKKTSAEEVDPVEELLKSFSI